ncbi:hypothetical protein [Vibrio chagasii]|uniref:hypothetical protein n=1 Tax=Vibrio chagasii TaxID=170679 RepID=UPI0037355935
MFKQGDVVIHKSRPELGNGLVVECNDSVVSVKFVKADFTGIPTSSIALAKNVNSRAAKSGLPVKMVQKANRRSPPIKSKPNPKPNTSSSGFFNGGLPPILFFGVLIFFGSCVSSITTPTRDSNGYYKNEAEAWKACNAKYNNKCKYLGPSFKHH